MTVTSTLSNFISNLKNHYSSKKLILKQKKTKQIMQLTDLLVIEGLICGYYFSDNENIILLLKYDNNEPSIRQIKMISKPGKRVYVNNKWLYRNKNEVVYILSTNNGIITQSRAQNLNLGGELICKIN